MQKIPKKIHFIYGLAEDFGGKEFCFMHWAAIRSAKKQNPEYEIHYWYQYLPINNYYFEDIKNLVILHEIEAPKEIFDKKLYAVAHQADVVRLEVLRDFGGIYLDIDTFTEKSFDELLNNSFFIGEQEVRGNLQGLCNAIMGSEKNSFFINQWYSEYKSFRSKGYDEYWSEHSVGKPLLLSAQYPGNLTRLPAKFFLKPDYSPEGIIDLVYLNKTYPDSICHHLWESGTYQILSLINEGNIHKILNSYTSMVMSVLSTEVEILRNSKLYKVIEIGSVDYHTKKLVASLIDQILGSINK
jgi:hypothetical protein